MDDKMVIEFVCKFYINSEIEIEILKKESRGISALKRL